MGTIRTLLALAVALYHSYGIFNSRESMTGGTVSVQAFYIISGFYMALILNEKYRKGPGSYKLFITNRFLRIYPLYWAMLFIVVAGCLVGTIFFDQPFYLWYWTSQWSGLHWSTIVIFIFANLFLFGSDWFFFSGVNRQTGMLEPARDAFMYQPMAFQFLLIPQIWSVGVELSFYLLAPLLLRAKWYYQLALLLASLGLRYYLSTGLQLNFDPWTYRFFPLEIAFFMAGSLCYLAWKKLKQVSIPKYAFWLVWSVIVIAIVRYPAFQFADEPARRWYFYGLFVLALPFIFMFSKNSKLDRIIGELSFPVYVSHHFIMFLWRKWFWEHNEYMEWFGIVTALSSLVMAVILWRLVMVPVERYRAKRFEEGMKRFSFAGKQSAIGS
jgi:peptidoglycan/LPS O-acetylase OafA/YrhL